jgi:hypothetical protein
LRFYAAVATVQAIPNITLAEWATREGISRRKAEYLAKKPGFPAVKERRKKERTIWQTVVPEDFKLSDLSS